MLSPAPWLYNKSSPGHPVCISPSSLIIVAKAFPTSLKTYRCDFLMTMYYKVLSSLTLRTAGFFDRACVCLCGYKYTAVNFLQAHFVTFVHLICFFNGNLLILASYLTRFYEAKRRKRLLSGFQNHGAKSQLNWKARF